MNKSALCAMLTVAMLAGCANQRFNIAGELPLEPKAKSEESQSFFVNGIGQKQTVDAAKVCGGAAKVEGVAVEQSGMDVLLGMMTFGIYTPRTARVYCK